MHGFVWPRVALALLWFALPSPAAAAAIEAPSLVDLAVPGRLVGSAGGGVFKTGAGLGTGLLFGVELGGAVRLPEDRLGAAAGFALGALLGYQAGNGLALGARYDDFELGPGTLEHARFQFATFTVRFTFGRLTPMPYVEAAAGLSFVSTPGPLGSEGPSVVNAGGGVGGGVALPLGRHVALALGLRDWLAPSNGALAQVLSLQLGVTLTTGGPRSPL